MAVLTTGKIAEVLFEKAIETYESQQMLLDKVDFWTPDKSDLQNAGNFIWRTVQQHAPILTGFDLTGQEQGIIEETYPALLGEPNNDFVEMRIDDLRDMQFWEKRGEQSGKRQASAVNSAIASVIATQGSLHVRSDATSGYNFIAEAQAIMNERQSTTSANGRCFLLNDRDTLAYGSDLAARQTLQGRPADTWDSGQIGANVAEFDVYTASFLPTLVGGASPDTTVVGDQSFAPQGGSVNAATGVVTNVDYRIATIPVLDETGYNVGDKIAFLNGADAVNSVGLDDKTETDQAMTFTIVAVNPLSIDIYPKPIAVDDVLLSVLEQAYANVDTTIQDLAIVSRLNVDDSVKTNLFWDKDAIEVMGGVVPAELFKEFSGKKVLTDTMKNGQQMYLIYDGNITTMNFQWRLFTWNGITMRNPQAAGVATRF